MQNQKLNRLVFVLVGLRMKNKKRKIQNINSYSNDRVDGVRPSMEFFMTFYKTSTDLNAESKTE